MPEEIITRDSAAFKELYRDIVKAIRAVDILIDTHRPTIGNELYLTSEEICSIFSISKRSLQNYRDNRQIPYTTLGGKILYPQSSLYKLLEQHYTGRKPLKRICSISTQHYAFAVNAFANVVSRQNTDSYEFTLRETRTYEIIDDVKNYRSELGILYVNEFNRKVLENCNIDPDEYSGFAFGIGIERIAMLKYGINNIGLMFENNLQFLKQFHE